MGRVAKLNNRKSNQKRRRIILVYYIVLALCITFLLKIS
jgi:hypothetical protein